MKITSENFIKHLKKGKEEALQYVIDEYIGIVKAVIYNALKSYNDPQIIEECISDTFLGVYENAKQFEGAQEDFRKWICTIAKFKAISKQRKLVKTVTFYEIEENSNATISAEEEYILKVSTEELLKMMSKLAPVDCDIFTMKYFLNMKNEEIAEHCGLTKAAIDNRLYRGKKRLQQICLGGSTT
ncbi:sigma-70 family RNA polymerase sigma factor [Bacillus ndiopicus]|uniref:sigma-70 family RNA polymerase sigma factor n=1 Tax=Bacillus ndiopicus TaxID=1347368 RepID=UPI0005A8DFB4|nr:sigma-70 family RNA polymerase sigma factor [Bacillus ndiopicus]